MEIANNAAQKANKNLLCWVAVHDAAELITARKSSVITIAESPFVKPSNKKTKKVGPKATNSASPQQRDWEKEYQHSGGKNVGSLSQSSGISPAITQIDYEVGKKDER